VAALDSLLRFVSAVACKQSLNLRRAGSGSLIPFKYRSMGQSTTTPAGSAIWNTFSYAPLFMSILMTVDTFSMEIPHKSIFSNGIDHCPT
jgi:hypothetical protein